MKTAAYIGGLLGIAVLTGMIVREGYGVVLQSLNLAGWSLLWLAPYRLLYFALYAVSWRMLLRRFDPQGQAGLGYLYWIVTVREAIDRLLPVASVGGGVAGVRLVRARGVGGAQAASSVIVEILLTLINLYLFTAIGLLVLVMLNGPGHEYHRLLIGFLLSLPMPIVTALLLRYGSMFKRMQAFLRPMVGEGADPVAAAALDGEIRAYFRSPAQLLAVGALQQAAFLSGAFEVWFALRLFGHPVGAGAAVVIESLTQAARHFAFFVPAGLGVQEAALVLIGQVFGVSPQLALAVSVAKRMREVLCGVPPLLSWQWFEGTRLRQRLARSKG